MGGVVDDVLRRGGLQQVFLGQLVGAHGSHGEKKGVGWVKVK